MSTIETRYARSFLAMSYVLGERQAEVSARLRDAEVQGFAAALGSPDRAERAKALAVELSRIALGLELGAVR